MRPSLRLHLCRTHQSVPTAKKKVDNLLIKFKAASADEMCALLCRASQRSALVGHSGPSRPIMLTLCTRYDWVSTLHWEGAKQSLEQLIEAESTPTATVCRRPSRAAAERTRRAGQLCLRSHPCGLPRRSQAEACGYAPARPCPKASLQPKRTNRRRAPRTAVLIR
jgi:hypothetical protein